MNSRSEAILETDRRRVINPMAKSATNARRNDVLGASMDMCVLANERDFPVSSESLLRRITVGGDTVPR
jgi:hypothetical protein